MPNWCNNHIEIVGPEDERKRLAELVRSGDAPFSFEQVVPQPEGLLDDDDTDTGTTPDWYHWRVQHWGTKWELTDDTVMAEYGDRTSYNFETAWAPCEPVVKELARRFPTLTIAHSWDEPGMDFGGYIVYVGGEVENREEGGSKQTTWADLAENLLP